MIMPGRVALVKWAPEGCPRDDGDQEDLFNMAHAAAEQGHLELVVWLLGEGGFEMDELVMEHAAWSGNEELKQWAQTQFR